MCPSTALKKEEEEEEEEKGHKRRREINERICVIQLISM